MKKKKKEIEDILKIIAFFFYERFSKQIFFSIVLLSLPVDVTEDTQGDDGEEITESTESDVSSEIVVVVGIQELRINKKRYVNTKS